MHAPYMIIERDVSIRMDDGLQLKADVFRPADGQPAPVIMTSGPYGKGVPYNVGFASQWKWLIEKYPDVLPGSARDFMVWETLDPQSWVPWGYVCIRVDSRGAGRSPGHLDVFSPRETKDFHDAIEWAGVQSWSTGDVGLCGISYYAMNQWQVASLQPSHLKAMIPWEGAADIYRDFARHGGIQSNHFLTVWYPRQVAPERATGPAEFTADELLANRSDLGKQIRERALDDEWYRARSPQWDKVTVPFLSAASWAGFGLHPRGNFEAFTQAASKQKWLECHPGRHEEWFYLNDSMQLQKRFFDHFLKKEANGWNDEPAVRLHERRPFSAEFAVRTEEAWPLPSTVWTPTFLGASDSELTWNKPDEARSVTFDALGDPLTFISPPLEADMEVTGPLAAKIFASSSTTDLDLFLTLQAFAPDGAEVSFQGTIDPHTPLAQGWLRASHRKLDKAKSLPYRPYHTHDEIQLLEPGKVYELDVEIWPTHVMLPAGYKLGLQISGKDFERPLLAGAHPDPLVNRGSGPFLHNDPEDRPPGIFGGQTTICTGGEEMSYLLLPIIPS
ncbi:hypothetical protein LTR27_012184 [Elasticomyces elasticus]|nr:hypothetical protein LTR27_012184 [Elasticomyces elasticus]